MEPAVPGLLRGILASEQEYRHNFIPGVFENHLDQMIAAEKRSVTHFLKEAAANTPRPAPNKKRQRNSPSDEGTEKKNAAPSFTF